MMTNDCPEALMISFSYLLLGGHPPSIIAWWKVENWNVFLRCCWGFIEHYTIQAHYNHDIAFVDQGGIRPTF